MAKDNTRKKLRNGMDELALTLVEHLHKLGPDNMAEKLAGFATVTNYLKAVNREPEAPEGEDLGKYRKRLDSLSAGRGGGRGTADSNGDPDDAASDDDDTGMEDGAGDPAESAAEPAARAA